MSAEINKAWWIGHVKEYGSGGGITYLAEKAGTYYSKAKPAIDLLVATGYVKMERKAKQVSYFVTSFGHRYLNENHEELEAATPAAAGEADPEPMAPVKVEAMPDTVRRDEPPRSTHVLRRSVAAEEPAERLPEPADKASRPAPSVDRPDAAADQQAIKDALYDIMYERFADQVTAKELLDRLHRNHPRQ